MNQPVLIIAVNSLALLLTVCFSLWISRRTRTAEGWSVGGRSLPLIVVVLTQFATASGGGMLVAQVGLGYQFGWGVVTYGVFTAGGVLALLFMARWLRQHDFVSLPDIIKKIYGGHRVLMTVVTLMTMVVPFGWLCTQLVAFANLFHQLTGVNSTVLAVAFAIVGLLFVLPGGMTSVAWSDAIFGAFMLLMAFVVGFYALHAAGGWSEVAAAATPARVGWEGFLAPGLLTIGLWAMSLTPGTMTNQMYFQRIYAANTLRTVVWSLIGTAALLLGTKVYASVLGMSAFALNPRLGNPEDAAGTIIAGMPLILSVAYSAFICQTLLSTVTSAVQSVVVNITQDIYKNYTTRDVTSRDILKLSRILSAVVLAVALVLSLAFPSALDWIVSSYAYSAVGLFFPVFLGFVLRRTNLVGPYTGIAGVVAGVLVAGVTQALGTNIPYVAYGLAASAAAMLVTGWLTRSRERVGQDGAVPVG
ncbi:sodium:solute symporter family protein [Marinitenerispora sediminis]|uniref:Sodium:proline symporter n=1 Tax=Marinitenerispora sediminis TaxID=1931232 RepID=A0A368TCR9_9ACTN|nr:sodium:solute symporter family protein [Marinitenerispora sediminis]RCV58121.1 sodium:proline symporter [Marinitenerispora sediminis]RCV58743.1 sodium:proline symporter [Marinitenerispora sediminis]RCV61394.1 sodium:proline symporter [Marinitenerispora sediminis]